MVLCLTTLPLPSGLKSRCSTGRRLPPYKGGRACSYTILGVVAWGDNSFGRAVREGDITTVASVDTSQTGVPILGTGSVCTVVEAINRYSSAS